MTETPKTIEERMAAMEEAMTTILDMMEAQARKIAEVDKKAVKKASGLFGGKRTKTAIKDTITGTIYPSKARLGKLLAGTPDFKDIDPANNFSYYQIIAKAPERFVNASDEEAEKAWEMERVAREKEVEEANKRLAEEEEAKKAKEAEEAKEAAAKAKAK